MAYTVKAHTRGGHAVRSYTRGGGSTGRKAKKSGTGGSSFEKLLGKIGKQHGKVMEAKNKVASLSKPKEAKKPTARKAQKNMDALFKKHNIQVDYTSPIKNTQFKRAK